MIYLDYNATTPCDSAVIESMLPYFSEKFGNAASAQHAYGWTADEAIKTSRNAIAQYLNCIDQEIVFTSGATESCNLAIKGVYENYKVKGNHIITIKTEHSAVLDTCNFLSQQGASITYLDVDKNGEIDLEELEQSISNSTILIAVMFANNETGVLQNIAAIGSICKKHAIPFFCDGTQAFGKIPIDVLKYNIDLLAFSAHKFYGPKGVGGLYVRRKNPRINLLTQLHGGGHERGRRSGTLNVPGIVGMAKALNITYKNTADTAAKLLAIRDSFEQQLSGIYPQLSINGLHANRLPHVSNITLPGISANKLIAATKSELAFSMGSACLSNHNKPSHVLTAMGLDETAIACSIRLSFGKDNSLDQLPTIINIFDSAIKQLIK